MTMLESTSEILKKLTEEDLKVVYGVSRRLLEKSGEEKPFAPMDQNLWEEKLNRSAEQQRKGQVRDALQASDDLRKRFSDPEVAV